MFLSQTVGGKPFNWRELLLASVFIIFTLWTFSLWKDSVLLIIEGEFGDYKNFILPVAALLLGASLFSLVAILVQNWLVSYSSLVVSLAGVSLILGADKEEKLLLGVALMVFLFALYRIHSEIALSIGFGLVKFLKSGLPVYFSGASLLISVFYFGAIDNEKAFSALLPKSLFNLTLERLSGYTGTLVGLPSINPNARMDEVLKELIKSELATQGININQLPASELNQLIREQSEKLAKNFGIKFDGREKLADVFYRALAERLASLLGPYQKYLPHISALVFFMALKTFTIPLYFLALFLTYLLLKILTLLKIIKKEKQLVEVEKLVLA